MTINKEQPVSDAMIEAGRALLDDYFGKDGWMLNDNEVAAIYLAMQAVSHPLEQQQAVSGDVVERVARAIYAIRPYCIASSATTFGAQVAQSFDWDGAPAYYQHDIREIARAALTASGVERMQKAREAMEQARRKWFCSGQDCEPFDHGRDEGFELAIKAFDEAMSRTALQEEGVERGDA